MALEYFPKLFSNMTDLSFISITRSAKCVSGHLRESRIEYLGQNGKTNGLFSKQANSGSSGKINHEMKVTG